MRVTSEIQVASPPERAWEVVGDLTGVDRWIPGVVSAELDGETRVCTTADGGRIVERISGYSNEARSYGYEHLEQPLPLARSHGTLSVRASGGDGSLIVWEAEFEPPNDEVGKMVEGAYRETLESLGRLVDRAAGS